MTKANVLGNGYTSISGEVKDIIRKTMEDGKEHERKEIVEAIKAGITDQATLTDGIIAGGIKMLTNNGELQVVNRGIYKKGVLGTAATVRERVLAIMEKFQSDLSKACTLNCLEIAEEDLEFIKAVGEFSGLVEAKIWDMTGEAKAEPVKEEVKAPEVKVETKPEPKASEKKVETKPEVKAPEAKVETKPEVKASEKKVEAKVADKKPEVIKK